MPHGRSQCALTVTVGAKNFIISSEDLVAVNRYIKVTADCGVEHQHGLVGHNRGMSWGFAIVEGLSMIPALAPGERVLVRYGANFSIGDIVLVDRGDRIDIKRVTRIEDSHIFVEGDNTAVSTDSRHYGAINRDTIIAKVIWRLPKNFRVSS
jgi:signal peptidase I